MSTPLRIALAYFSFVPLQRWLNWIFGALLGVGLLREFAAHGYSAKSGWMVLATVAAMIVAAAPAFAGGAVMRTASTPPVMHLRPQGRRHMLVGATLAITLVAILMTLPLLVFQLTGTKLSIKAIEFSTPAFSMFQMVWGSAALAWVIVFAMSRYPTLGVFSFMLLIVLGNVIVRLASLLPITADQIATGVCAAGVAAWIAFGIWYMNAASVLRSGGIAELASGQTFPGLTLLNRHWSGRPAAKNVSRTTALYQYFVGSGSYWSQVWIGGLMTTILVVLPQFFVAHLEARTPYQTFGLGLAMMISGLIMAPQVVRRSRLLWLRAALDRAALFAAAERHAGIATLAMLSVPVILFLTLSVAQRPDLALNIMLFTVMQLTFASCLLYAGLTATRRQNWGSMTATGGLLLVFVIVSRTMEPDKELSAWAYLVAVAISGTVALGLRWTALREWRILDWRVTGPAVPRNGLRGT